MTGLVSHYNIEVLPFMLLNPHIHTFSNLHSLFYFFFTFPFFIYFLFTRCCTVVANYLQALFTRKKRKKKKETSDRFINALRSIMNTLKFSAFPYRSWIVTI